MKTTPHQWDRRRLVLALAAGASGASRPARAAPRPLAIDTLCFESPEFDARAALQAGMTGCLMDLKIEPRVEPAARAELSRWTEVAAAPDSAIRIIRTSADFGSAHAANRFAVVLNCQDCAILQGDGDNEDRRFQVLQEFHDLGLRVLQLTYNDRNLVGGGYWEDTEVPLSLYGKRLVQEMNRIGVLIDVSHCDDATTLDAIQRSARPVAITHAGCRALFESDRNKSDATIRALANKGGYFGVFNMTLWMTSAPGASAETIADHVDHVVKVGGIETAGFGSDHPVLGEPRSNENYWVESMKAWAQQNLALGRTVSGPRTDHVYAPDLNGADRLDRLRGALKRRGYREADLDKVTGLNFVRVFRDACG